MDNDKKTEGLVSAAVIDPTTGVRILLATDSLLKRARLQPKLTYIGDSEIDENQ
jgi:hypothetical protein